jgi:hypothetical protein
MKTLPSVVRTADEEREVVEELASQVGQLLGESKKPNFCASMSAVLYHRNGGRFGYLYRKVARHLSMDSANKRKQMALPLGV